MSVDPCPTCHRLPLNKDPEAAEQLLRAIRKEDQGRLYRAEMVLAAHEEHRLNIAAWLVGMLKRPPLNSGFTSWAGIVAFVDALWWDIAFMTDDPLSPVVDGMVVPQPHPRLFEKADAA